MRRILSFAIALAAVSTPAAAQQPPSTAAAASGLRVGAPTFFADGKTTGASATGWTLQPNQPLVLYVYSGATQCESVSPSTAMPTTAGFGWRVSITPKSAGAAAADGGVSFDVTWQRYWENSTKLTEPALGPVQITLHKGERVMLDYITANAAGFSRFWIAKPGGGVTGNPQVLQGYRRALESKSLKPAARCNAIGMGLEIGLDGSRAATTPVEIDLWLVRTTPDRKEQTQQQRLRLKQGESMRYQFEPVEGFPTRAKSISVSGLLTILQAAHDQPEKLSMTIQSRSGNGPDTTASLDVNLSSITNEVFAFPVPGPKSFFFFNEKEAVGPTVDKLELRMRTGTIR